MIDRLVSSAVRAGRPGTLRAALADWRARSWTRLSQHLLLSGDLAAAKRFGRRAVAAASMPGVGPVRYAQALLAMGSVLARLAEYEQAAKRLRQAVMMLEATSEVSLLVGALTQLGDTLRSTGRYDQAERVLDRAARLAGSQSDPLVTAGAVNSLGICCKDTGRYGEARSLYERARHLVETQLGTGHPAMADIWHNLAGLDHACNEHGAGESAIRRAMELHRLGGESSPALAGDLAVLAVLFSAQDRLDEAEALHRQALATFEQVYGSDHYEIAVNLNGLAFIHQRRGDYAAAEPLLRRALTIKQRVLGPNHPEIGSLLNTLGVTKAVMGRPPPASPQQPESTGSE